MAPTQNKSSDEANVSTSDVKCCHCGGFKNTWDMFLPITPKGSFFQDSFFSDMHQHYDAAVREVLNKWKEADLKLTEDLHLRHNDVMESYRQLRSRNLKEENQAVTVTSDNANNKIVLDVHDFKGNVQVKVVGERELVVEGRVEKTEDGRSSLNTFRRCFSLPYHTDMTSITSAMSSDGILTITVPKLKEDGHHKTTIIPIKIDEAQTDKQKNASKTTASINKEKEEYNCEHCRRGRVYKNEESQQQTGIKYQVKNNTSQSDKGKGSQDFVPSSKPSIFQQNQETSAKETKVQTTKAKEVVVPITIEGNERENLIKTNTSRPTTNATNENKVQSGDKNLNNCSMPTSSKISLDAKTNPRPSSAKQCSRSPNKEESQSLTTNPSQTSASSTNQENIFGNEEMQKQRSNGAKFPIKINGSVINSNAV